MGIFDSAIDFAEGAVGRSWDIASGIGEGVLQIPLFAYDMATAVAGQGKYDDPLDALWNGGLDRVGNILENTIGPDRGIGAAFGAIPEEARHPFALAFEGVNKVYKEVIDQPLATLANVINATDTGGGFWDWDPGAMFSGKTWGKAYDLSEDISFGQSVILGLTTDNIFDPEEVLRAQGSDLYQFASLGIDLAIGWYLDPLVIVGKAVKIGREASQIAKGGQNLVDAQRIPGKLELAYEQKGKIKKAEEMIARGEEIEMPRSLTKMQRFRMYRWDKLADLTEGTPLAFARWSDGPTLSQRIARRLNPNMTWNDANAGSMIRVAEKGGKWDQDFDWMTTQHQGFLERNPGANIDTQRNFLAGVERDVRLSGASFKNSNPQAEAMSLANAFLGGRDTYKLKLRSSMGDGDATIKLAKGLEKRIAKKERIESFMVDLNLYNELTMQNMSRGAMRFARDRTLDDLFLEISAQSGQLTTTKKAAKELSSLISREHIIPEVRGFIKPRPFWETRPFDREWNETASMILQAEVGAITDDIDTIGTVVRNIDGSLPTLTELRNKDFTPAATFSKVPEISRGSKMRYAMKNSDIYQNSFMSKPLRMWHNMLPHKVIDHSQAGSDVQISRMLNQVRSMAEDERKYWRGVYMAEPTAQGKMNIAEEIITKVVEDVGRNTGVSNETMVDYLNRVALRRRVNQHEFSRFTLPDPNVPVGFITARGVDETHAVAVLAKEQSVLTFVPDFRRFEVEMAKRAKRERRFANIDYTDDMKLIEKNRARGNKILNEMFPYRESEGIVGNLIRSPGDLLDQAQQIWVKNVLIRPAFTFRVALGDEQVRMAAKFMGLWGTATLGASVRQGMQNWIVHALENEYKIPKWMGYTHEKLGRSTDVRAAIAGGAMGFLFSGGLSGNIEEDPFAVLTGTLLGGIGNTVVAKKLRTLKKVPYDLGLRPLGTSAAFGNQTDDTDKFMRLNSSSVQSIPESFWRTSGARKEEIANWGHFQSIKPKDMRDYERYKASWEYTANETLRQDPMAKVIMEKLIERQKNTPTGELIDLDGFDDEIVNWLWKTDDGRAVRRQMQVHHRNVEDSRVWIEQAYDQINNHFIYGGKQDLTDPNSSFWNAKLMQDLVDGKQVSFDDYFKYNDEAIEQLPTINGASMRETLGTSKSVGRVINDSLESGMDWFARLPTDFMSRNRTFAAFYEMDVRRQVTLLTGSGKDATMLSKRQIQSIEDKARHYALGETKELLYDLAERSEFAEMMKFIMPFYPAYQEVVTRYASLAVENPVWAARLHELWGAPERAPAMYHEDPNTGEKYLRIRLPSFAKGLAHHTFFQDAFDDQDEIMFSKDSFNMISQGPGFGPFVQVPMAEIFKDNPNLEDTANVMFPFGPPDDIIDTFLSGGERRLIGLSKGMESEEFASAFNQILMTKFTNMMAGEIPMIDMNDPIARGKFMDDVMSETKNFAHARVWATMFSPAAPRFSGPHRPYVDAYRVMKEEDPENADKNFISQFGDEYFPMTQSFTKSLAGIPPTTEAYKLSKEFSDLMIQFPTYGGVITGSDAGGTLKFSRFAYDKQLETPLFPGSQENQRERYSPAQIIDENRTKLSWIKFSQSMDLIDAAMEERGLPNLRMKAAEDLRLAKSIVVQNLGQENHEWLKEYYTRDPMMWKERITAFTAFTQNRDLMQRGDIQGLSQYLGLRAQMQQILGSQGIKSTDSIKAQPYMEGFESAVQSIVANNLQFADIYHRYLDTDPVLD